MATIKIVVFQGDQPELLPGMCMFCARQLTEDQYQSVVLRAGTGVARPVSLPICSHDRIDGVVQADADAQGAVVTAAAFAAFGVLGAAIAHNVQQEQQRHQAFFTFHDVHERFADELHRLRHLTPKEYDHMMAKANQAFAAKIAASADVQEAERKRQAREAQQAEDEATFGLAGAAGKGKVTEEVVRSSSTKFLIAFLVVGVISVLLLICISASLIGYVMSTRKPAPAEDDVVVNKPADAPKELRARIKVVDAEQQTIKFLLPGPGGAGISKIYSFKDSTIFYDKKGDRLPGAEALKVDD